VAQFLHVAKICRRKNLKSEEQGTELAVDWPYIFGGGQLDGKRAEI
jgi:hypothetical protein